jgi:hypothetical protein
MLFTLVAVLCNTLPGPELCVEEIVAHVPYPVCTISGQKLIAPWMESGKYAQDWRLESYKCEGAEYVVRGNT